MKSTPKSLLLPSQNTQANQHQKKKQAKNKKMTNEDGKCKKHSDNYKHIKKSLNPPEKNMKLNYIGLINALIKVISM